VWIDDVTRVTGEWKDSVKSYPILSHLNPPCIHAVPHGIYMFYSLRRSNPNLTQSLYQMTDKRVEKVSILYQMSNIMDKLKTTFINSNEGDLTFER
jgi:hypothetical protein